MTDRTPRSGAPARRPAPGQRPRPASRTPQRPDSAPRKNNGKKKKKKSKGFVIMKKIFSAIVTTLLSLFLIMVITSTIVATALTIYVLDFMEDSTSITLAELESGSDTHFYGTKVNEEGEIKYIPRVKKPQPRISKAKGRNKNQKVRKTGIIHSPEEKIFN